jgi:hypothetical protein
MEDIHKHGVHKPHWYKLFILECPSCGNFKMWRERQYTSKPERPEERVVADFNAYDNCEEQSY